MWCSFEMISLANIEYCTLCRQQFNLNINSEAISYFFLCLAWLFLSIVLRLNAFYVTFSRSFFLLVFSQMNTTIKKKLKNKESNKTNQQRKCFILKLFSVHKNIHINVTLLSHGVEIFSSEQTIGNDKTYWPLNKRCRCFGNK